MAVFRPRRIGAGKTLPQFNCYILIDRTRMRLLFFDTQVGQQLEYDARLHLKLARQLVDSDFLHRRDC